jgi:hypothetical protein
MTAAHAATATHASSAPGTADYLKSSAGLGSSPANTSHPTLRLAGNPPADPLILNR